MNSILESGFYDFCKYRLALVAKSNAMQNKENFAAIISFKKYQEKENRKLGILKGKASYKIKDNFKMTDEELLSR
jgi:hypothetical protein